MMTLGPELQEQFKLRIPIHLSKRIRASAQANRRSLNSEIIVLVEQALPAETKEAEAAATAPAL